jgi:hypothetical protein
LLASGIRNNNKAKTPSNFLQIFLPFYLQGFHQKKSVICGIQASKLIIKILKTQKKEEEEALRT